MSRCHQWYCFHDLLPIINLPDCHCNFLKYVNFVDRVDPLDRGTCWLHSCRQGYDELDCLVLSEHSDTFLLIKSNTLCDMGEETVENIIGKVTMG